MTDLTSHPDSVAIIGMAGRFPGAPDVETLWANLLTGREGVSALSPEELRDAGVDPRLAGRSEYVPAKGVLADADRFDAGFFGYSPREAEKLDPQHRVFLETAWHTLESAGIDPATFDGRIGVFAGASLNSYLLFNLATGRRATDPVDDYQTLLASDKDFLATRASYKLGLTGPSITVQTACSTSLTAVHLACQSLLGGECDVALAGGVSVSVPLQAGYLYATGGILSPDGHCRPFDAEAAGTVAGNGVALVALRRLPDAIDAGDRIDAVIRGTAINNDGAMKVGYTAPSVDGQAAVIAEALAVADVDARTIGHLQAHGTGTRFGDPIEVAALRRVFRESTDDTGFCALSSVKSSVGHLDAAAGVTGLITAALAVSRGVLPPTLHYRTANPELALEASPFVVDAEARAWPPAEHPRRAGVSSFGIGGTNVHVVLEQPPATRAVTADGAEPSVLLPLSASSAAALTVAAERLADHLESHPDVDAARLADTLTHRRRRFDQRAAVVGTGVAELAAALRRIRPAASRPRVPVAMLFPGQGTQYAGMGRDLYRTEPAFAAEIDRCASLFAPHLGLDLREVIFGGTDEQLRQTALTQPALFTVEYATAQLWRAYGVQPAAMAGHSIGEYVAACLAGVFTLADAARIVAVRGRLVASMPPGAMLAVFLPETETRGWLDDALCLGAVNGSGLTVVSGPVGAVEDLRRRMVAAGVGCRAVATSHAFHSASMDAAVGPLVEAVAAGPLAPPAIPFCSDVTGGWITPEEATDPAYWGRHLRATVRFADALDTLLADPSLAVVEAGPGRSGAELVRRHPAGGPDRVAVESLPASATGPDERTHFLGAAGALWCAGVAVTPPRRAAAPPLADLPPYPFERGRYWVDPASRTDPAGTPGAASDGLYVPVWQRSATVSPGDRVAGTIVVLGADVPAGRAIAASLAARGATVVPVHAGPQVRRSDDGWTADLADRAQLTTVLDAVAGDSVEPLRLVHACTTEAADGPLDRARIGSGRRRGLDSLVAVGQAVGGRALPVRLDVLTAGVFGVTGDEELHPEHAPLLGAATVLPQEIEGLTCRVLDVTGADPSAVATAYPVAPPHEGRAALRGRYWWTPDVAPLEVGTGRSRLRDGGVYLITGGLGGVGMALAEHFARSVEAPVLGLLSRASFPAEEAWDAWETAHAAADPTSRRIRRLRDLRAQGARVVLLRADVTDPDAVRAAVGTLRRSGPLNGVVHAAGLPSRGLVAGKTPTDIDEVTAAKTLGTTTVADACAAEPLDFLVLCSSLTALLGGPGQSDYAGANAFLDTWAQEQRTATDLPVSAVAWDTWQETGMAADLSLRLGSGRATGHPLLQRLLHEAPDARTYTTTLRTDEHWVVAEHRLQGHGLVPGTTYLELVRAAVADDAAGRDIELRNVLFTMPVLVPDGLSRTLYTTVERRDDGMRFAVRTRAAAGWQEHATGEVAFAPAEPVTRDLDAVRRACAAYQVLDTEEEIARRLNLDRVAADGVLRFDFGPRWRCLRTIEVGAEQLIVTLRLADAFAEDLVADGPGTPGPSDGYPLHPALLDVAGAAARISAKDVYYLPFTYRTLRVSGPLTQTVHCVVTPAASPDSGETFTCDLEMLDPAGRVLVGVREFTIKRINDVDALRSSIDAEVAAAASAVPAEEAAQLPSVLRTLAEGMSPAAAVAAFDRLLAAPVLPEYVLVAGRDPAALLRLARSVTPGTLAEEAGQVVLPPRGSHPRPDLPTPYVEPRTDSERAVAGVWQDVLGLDRVGADDDFFALGGHSLAAVQIGVTLRDRFGVELDLPAFFDGPTVARTAAVIDDGGAGTPADRIEARSRDEDVVVDDLTDDEVDARLRELLAADVAPQEGTG